MDGKLKCPPTTCSLRIEMSGLQHVPHAAPLSSYLSLMFLRKGGRMTAVGPTRTSCNVRFYSALGATADICAEARRGRNLKTLHPRCLRSLPGVPRGLVLDTI